MWSARERMDATFDIVTLGEAMACFVPTTAGPLRHVDNFEKHVAGAEFNSAVGAARLGLRVGWISRVGDDGFGKEIICVLRGEGVDVSHVLIGPGPTGVYFKEYSALGEPMVYYYRRDSAASRLGPDDIDPTYIAQARVLHVTGITPLLSKSCYEATLKAIHAAREAGVSVCFDPNIRYRLITPEAVGDFYRPFLSLSDLVLAGVDELEAIMGGKSSSAELGARVLELGPTAVAIKKGADGAAAYTSMEGVEEPAFTHRNMVDPIGAGDGFNAGFLSGWLQGHGLRESVRLGNVVGAYAIGVRGDYEGYPDLSQVQAVLGQEPYRTR